jgi:tRNA (adenine-N(1)-)-methyltransferase non-catalytic subunit
VKNGGRNNKNPGWNNLLRPLRRSDVVDAIVGESQIFHTHQPRSGGSLKLTFAEDIVETNEFIDDTETGQELLTQEAIAEMRAQGMSAEDIMKAQIARHERFGLKTDFSKEKWRKRKEKK